jgi:hypothetical protein
MAATRQRRNPADHTGAQRDKLEKEHREELERRSQELGMATQAANQASDEVTDYSGVREIGAEVEGAEAVVVGGDEPVIVDSGERSVEVRINTDLEDVTIGAGNNFNFKEGGKYRVPLHVAQHLEEKGYVWH